LAALISVPFDLISGSVAGEYILFIEHAQIIAFVSYPALAGTSTIEEASKDF